MQLILRSSFNVLRIVQSVSFCLQMRTELKTSPPSLGIRSNQLVGYGIVVGLAGSGDGNTGITLQSMQSLVARFGITSELEWV